MKKKLFGRRSLKYPSEITKEYIYVFVVHFCRSLCFRVSAHTESTSDSIHSCLALKAILLFC